MKITKSYIKQVIKEELGSMEEAHGDAPGAIEGQVDKNVVLTLLKKAFPNMKQITITAIEPLSAPFGQSGEYRSVTINKPAVHKYMVKFQTGGSNMAIYISVGPKSTPQDLQGYFSKGDRDTNGNFYALEYTSLASLK